MKRNFLRIHPKDNIIVALCDLPKGQEVNLGKDSFVLTENITAKHKFAFNDFVIGDDIIMYGVLVGSAAEPISKGAAITIKNVEHASADYTVGNKKSNWEKPDVGKWQQRTFMGYHRKDGSVGTANYWLVIPMVFCENRNVEVLKSALQESLGYSTKNDFVVDTQHLIQHYRSGSSIDEVMNTEIIRTPENIKKNRVFPNVDGIKFLTHDGGCGGFRQDSEALTKLFAGYITNPNVAGATILSLGCQNAEVKNVLKSIQDKDPQFSKPLYILEQQQSKSERDFIAEAVKKTFMGLMEADKIERKPALLHHLALGLECGGSDGFSGISANPVLGNASDLLVALGATAVLSEFPELNGVEQELINRCDSTKNAKKFRDLMNSYATRAVALGSSFKNNPSPGNIKDGLITDAMKSAGAAKKGGTSPVTDVLDYTEKVTKKGLNLLCTPGNDVESTTGLAGSGCNIICFTTGLGTPTGNPIAPVIKISSNQALTDRMGDIIDFNTGTIVTGEDTIEAKAEELLEYIIKVASGEELPAAVRLGQDDFIPWKRGMSL